MLTTIRLATICLLLVAAVACGGGSSGNTDARFLDGTNTTTPVWVVRQSGESAGRPAIVFVHGIFGDTLKTWTNDNGTTFFDLLNSVPEIAGQADMLAVGFPSSMFGSGAFDIREAANRLHQYLDFHRVLAYDKIVFIAHSMGGLVVLRELLTQRQLMPKVPVVVFFGTPQEGAFVANIGRHILNNPALSDMSEADGNTLLQTLSDEWNVIPPAERPHVRCGYEDRDTFGFKIVPWSSATRFCEGATPAIPGNHLDIVKPTSVDDDAIVVAANALREYVFNAALAPNLETPDFVTDGDRLVLNLTDAIGRQSARLINTGGSSLRFSFVEVSNPLLYLWPQDATELGPGTTDVMQVALGFGATENEYGFVLRTDVWPDREVVVRVPDIQALRSQQQQLLQTASTAIETLLADPESAAGLTQAAADDQAVPARLAAAVRQGVATLAPDLPETAQWILTAEVFNATNWSPLAAVALREAEATAPHVARDPAVQRLAAATSWYSGEHQIFASTATPLLSPQEAAALPDRNLLVGSDGIGVERATVLATQLQAVPALKVYGLSLQGDAMVEAGDEAAAERSFDEAVMVRPTPSVSRRLRTVRDR